MSLGFSSLDFIPYSELIICIRSLIMTFISSETRTLPRRTSSASDYVVRDGIVMLAGSKAEDASSVPRPIPVRQMSKLVQRRPQSTALVDEFIRSFKELESYK